MTIRTSHSLTREEWNRIAGASSYATFFHTPAWYDLAASFYGRGSRPAGERIVFEDGTVAALPYLEVPLLGGLLRLRESSPFGTYGGWIGDRPLSLLQAKVLVDRLLRKRSVSWRENPFDETLRDLPVPQTREDFTSVVELDGTMEELYRRSSSAHHKALKRAARENVTVRLADTLGDWRSYYAVYQDSLRRWREGAKVTRVVYPWEFFERLHAMEGRKLFLAQKNGEVIAGVVCFYHNRHAVAWHGAALGSHFESRPNNILYWEAIADALHGGFRRFDCNPSGGYVGVERFKAHLGAKKLRSRVVERRPWVLSLAGKIRRAIRR